MMTDEQKERFARIMTCLEENEFPINDHVIEAIRVLVKDDLFTGTYGFCAEGWLKIA